MKNTQYNHINVIITTTYFCNMQCVYCYNNRQIHDRDKSISIDTVKRLIEITVPYYNYVHFLFHGGEPLSMGKNFYEEIIRFQKEVNTYGTEITNSIQTNLTLLDADMARFLLDNKIKVGSSFDGRNNDLTRHCSERILKGHEVLKSLGGNNGFIYVVQQKNINCLLDDYKWFKSNHIGYNHNMYLPSYPCEQDPLFVPPELFAEKMCELFDIWMQDKECDIHLGYFETILDYILNGRKRICCYNDCIGKHIGVRYDGSIYGCNRDLPSVFSYGNVIDYDNIRDCFKSKGCNNYLLQAVNRRKFCMETCDIYDFCHGGCNSVALQNGSIENVSEPVCEALKMVYKHIKKKVESSIKKDFECNKINPMILDIIGVTFK